MFLSTQVLGNKKLHKKLHATHASPQETVRLLRGEGAWLRGVLMRIRSSSGVLEQASPG